MKAGRIPILWAALLASLALVSPGRATTVVQPTFDNLVGSAEYVVRGVVKSVNSEWRDNAARPGQRYIATRVEIDVREVLKGTPPSPLVLDVVGGKVGQDELIIDGAPKFKVGAENILFIRDNGRAFTPLVGLMHGFYPVRRDTRTGEAQVLRYDGRLLYNSQDLSPATTGAAAVRSPTDRPLTPESFRNLVQQQQNDILTREKQR